MLTPLLRGEPVDFKGELYQVQGRINVPGAQRVPLVVAALGNLMLGHLALLGFLLNQTVVLGQVHNRQVFAQVVHHGRHKRFLGIHVLGD